MDSENKSYTLLCILSSIDGDAAFVYLKWAKNFPLQDGSVQLAGYSLALLKSMLHS